MNAAKFYQYGRIKYVFTNLIILNWGLSLHRFVSIWKMKIVWYSLHVRQIICLSDHRLDNAMSTVL